MYPDRVILGSENYPREIGFRWPRVMRLPYVIGDFTWTAVDYIGEAGIGKAACVEPDDPRIKMGPYALHESQYPWRLANDADLDITGSAAIFSRVEFISMEEINTFSTASLITRSTNDITQVQMLIAMGLQVLVKAPVMAVWAISKISTKSWQWSAVTAVIVVLLLVLIGVLMVFVMPRFKKIQKLTDNLNRVTRENESQRVRETYQ